MMLQLLCHDPANNYSSNDDFQYLRKAPEKHVFHRPKNVIPGIQTGNIFTPFCPHKASILSFS